MKPKTKTLLIFFSHFFLVLSFCVFYGNYSLATAMASTGYEEIYYEGGDGTDNWAVVESTVPVLRPATDPAGATLSEVNDGGNTVLQTSGNGTNGMDNSYELRAFELAKGKCQLFDAENGTADQQIDKTGCWANEQQTKLDLKIKTMANPGDFAIYVYVETDGVGGITNYNPYSRGLRIIKYTPENINMGGAEVNWNAGEMDYYSVLYKLTTGNFPHDYPVNFGGKTLHYGLGSGLADGDWHTINRDIKQDLQNLQPNVNFTLKGIRKIEIRGNVRIQKLALDFTDEEFEKMDKFQKDPGWAYDTGWLDMHKDSDNPAGKVQCDLSTGRRNNCSNPPITENCRSITGTTDSRITFDASDLPSAIENDCYITMNNEYTYNSSLEGIQSNEVVLITINTGSEEKSLLFGDPGEGRHQLTSTEPFTLRKGLNTLYFRSAGFCGNGDSIHFGRMTRQITLGASGLEDVGLDAFRIKCGAGANALDLQIEAKTPINSGEQSKISWLSTNAKTCIPSAGFFDGIDNDWQNMTPIWNDLHFPLALAPAPNPSWPSYSTRELPSVIYPGMPFTTNPLTESVSYTLSCKNEAGDQNVTKTAKVNVLTGYNDPTCQDFSWDRVSSKNNSGTNNDPLNHPTNILTVDGTGNIVAPPVAGNGTSFEPVYNLSAGNHSLYVKIRERNARSDKFIITKQLTGLNPDDSSTFDASKHKIELEAENCTQIGTAIKTLFNYTASNGSFREFYFWDPIWPAATSTHYLQCDFTVPAGENGLYAIWGRSGTPFETALDESNSFWISVDLPPNNASSFILWEFSPAISAHCMKFDFWGGLETDKGSVAPIAITPSTPLTLWWETGNLQQVNKSMNSSGLADATWQSLQSAMVNTPPYYTQIVAPPSDGTYIYQLKGIFNGSVETETKQVVVNVNSGSLPPPNSPGVCGHVCLESHCTLPATGLCTFPSTLDTTDPAYAPTGIKENATGWQWECKGSGTGADSPCTATKDCGWKER